MSKYILKKEVMVYDCLHMKNVVVNILELYKLYSTIKILSEKDYSPLQNTVTSSTGEAFLAEELRRNNFNKPYFFL